MEDWEEHLEGILEDLAPTGHLETVLAERVALLSWRLHRVTRYETETIALSQERIEDDLADRRRFLRVNLTEGIHPEDVRTMAKYAAARHRLFKRLPKLEDERVLPAEDAEAILWDALSRTDVVARGEETEEEILSRLSIPGLPEGVEWEEFEGWTAGLVRAGLEAIARATGEDPEALLKVATEEARREALSAKYQAEQVERDLERMSRERLLPDDTTLQKITRYEAHLCRLLYKTLHELEALQARRSGQAAPLARLDIDGLPEG
ncbi:hypothetical protein [Rubrobacter xylanophilus]|uniref:hypothetical protein n=1 Tax=Rubrobacter xylanophilus TaxID=49319 RepID=UPI001C63ED7C|nr:hypothetical protein [Rubrobacter xylanophilus]